MKTYLLFILIGLVFSFKGITHDLFSLIGMLILLTTFGIALVVESYKILTR